MAQSGPAIVVAIAEPLRSLFFPGEIATQLEELGHVRWADPGQDGAPAVMLADAEVLVTAWGFPRLDADLLARAPLLRLVAHTGASVRFLVSGALFGRGIHVTQAGAAMARPVAEVSLAFTLALLHQVQRFDHALRTGEEWSRAKSGRPRHELAGSRIGVIGASRTGRAYIQLIAALGARVCVSDPYLTEADAARLNAEVQPLARVLATSRIVAVHAPAIAETRHLLGPRELALLPDGAGLVNTARSALVDTGALLAELRSGRIDAALDVYDEEPLPADSPLRALPGVLLTPHEAGGTIEARRRAGQLIVDEIRRYRDGGSLQHAITEAALPRLG
jgi:phosphoglycerate dehydrogenase-like enzyme